ncbi:aldose 1-epimerase family protein [Microvirga puerhi]|uniref:Aldose 1-epimerase family protein n=1 Tax=Microvirga puerhi TaxID=2876078 RepID=A0ABS7VNT3_9HYPH|nr:aldose 1-epimerase family protein [Microvirga puerhi]MBZ6077208.1 aldose 1-epimerase family protein [Microvirga puerhi]
MITIANDSLTVDVSPLGAELQAIRDAGGRSWLWHGDSTFWAGRAPLLFPVIGKSFDGKAMIEGTLRPMAPHGFARTSRFEAKEVSESHCVLRLEDSEETRKCFPFRFTLDISFHLDGSSLEIETRIFNRDKRPMPFCFGYHPAFPWPLPGAKDEESHEVHLGTRRAPKLLRIDANGLLKDQRLPSPFVNGVLTLKPDLFVEDAMIFDDPDIKTVWYGAPGHPGVHVAFPNMPHLGIWTKPGASFLCIEPWHGLPAPVGKQEPLEERAGAIILQPEEEARLPMVLSFGVEDHAS